LGWESYGRIGDMSNPGRGELALQKVKSALRRGDPTASNNIAAQYRELGDLRRAFQWWKRTAGPSDGDAWLEVGYCLQYGSDAGVCTVSR
jgi:hypothetical protein